MESGSDEEFFDAEDFTPAQSAPSEKLTEQEPVLKPSNDILSVNDKSDQPEGIDCTNILLKDKVILDIQDDCGVIKQPCNKDIELQNKKDNDAKLAQSNKNIEKDVVIQQEVPTDVTNKNKDIKKCDEDSQSSTVKNDIPVPVAPPRRKRKDKKKPIEVKDVTNDTSKNLAMSMNSEMKQLLTDFLPSSESIKESSVEEIKDTSSLIHERQSPNAEASNKPELTDEEILGQVVIKNLDTGEIMPLSEAKEKLPECTNPLALHIYKLASEQETESVDSVDAVDEEDHFSDTASISSGNMHHKRKKLKAFFGKTVQKIRSVADEVKARQKEDLSSDDEQDEDEDEFIKFKHHKAIKDQLMFKKIKLLQDLSSEHMGAVWTMKFSVCGKLLATAGQDNTVRIWVLKDYASHFEEMRLKYSRSAGRSSPTGSMTSSASVDDDALLQDLRLACGAGDETDGPFRKLPFINYHGHTSDVLDLSWSKNYFLLSSSMDKTVRLWHVSRSECLCCFQHIDFVTAICFHPKDDRYFLSGSLDGKIRLWNIPEKKVALWNEIDGSGSSLITAANFCMNGTHAAVGTFDGRCIFYNTQELKYHTQVTVRSSRGKNSRARKVSGIEPMPGEEKVLITTNDSRIRLYDLKDHSLSCKYKGLQNESSQIKASFNNDGSLILCGSEDKFVYIWNTQHDVPNMRKDRNEYYESFSAHDAVVTATIFAPIPSLIIGEMDPQKFQSNSTLTSKGSSSLKEPSKTKPFEVLVAADWQGGIKLYINS